MSGPLKANDLTPHALSDKFDLTEFRNENPKFENYLRKYAPEDDKKNIGRVFLFIHNVDNKIVGYVTIAMAHISREGHKKLIGLTRYPNIPALLLGQMARNLNYSYRGAGPLLLDWVINHGIELSQQVGCRLIILKSVPKKVEWYQENNFVLLEEPKDTLFFDLLQSARR